MVKKAFIVSCILLLVTLGCIVGHYIYRHYNPKTFSPYVSVEGFKVISKPTPNVNWGLNKVKGVVLHHTASSLKVALGILTKPNGWASCHVVIGQDGTRYVLARPSVITWHAGRSLLNGECDNKNSVNSLTIGIEFVGNTLKTPLTDMQIRSGIKYLLPIIKKYHIPLENITTHRRVRDAWNKTYPKKKTWDKEDITDKEYLRFMSKLKKELKKIKNED